MGMPRRCIHYYSSDNCSKSNQNSYLYYCKYTGNLVLSRNTKLDYLPTKRNDSSKILHRKKHNAIVYTTYGGVEYFMHKNSIHKRYIMKVGRLPVCYSTTPCA